MRKLIISCRRRRKSDGKKSGAYIVQEIYNPDGSGRIPYKELEAIFGINRLDSSVTQLITAKKPQKWRVEVDKKIFLIDKAP